MDVRGAYQRSRHELTDHVIDCTAVATAANPLFGFFENVVAGMSDETSLHARLYATGLTYLGVGTMLARGRDLSRRYCGVTDKSSELKQNVHDALYTAAFNAVMSPPLYILSGARSFKEIAWATGAACVTSLPFGAIAGYSIDALRDLTGRKESARLPNLVQRQQAYMKRIAAVTLIAASVLVTGAIYKMTPDQKPAAAAQQMVISK